MNNNEHNNHNAQNNNNNYNLMINNKLRWENNNNNSNWWNLKSWLNVLTENMITKRTMKPKGVLKEVRHLKTLQTHNKKWPNVHPLEWKLFRPILKHLCFVSGSPMECCYFAHPGIEEFHQTVIKEPQLILLQEVIAIENYEYHNPNATTKKIVAQQFLFYLVMRKTNESTVGICHETQWSQKKQFSNTPFKTW